MSKRIRKVLAVMLSVMMLCGLLAGCSGGSSTPSKKSVNIIVKVPALTMNTYADESIRTAAEFLNKAAADFIAQYEDYDVTIEVVQFAQEDETAAIPEALGTVEAPDVVYAGYFNISTYIHTGYVTPVDDIITSDIRNDIPDSWWESSMLNGKTYMMPYLGLENVLCFNKQMFLDAGLDQYVLDEDVVQNWSIDEWNTILAALRESLPEGSYPLMLYAGNNQGDTHVMTFLRMFGSTFFDETGHVDLTTTEGIEALQWIRDGVNAGYFPANAENMVSNDAYNLFINNQLAIVFNNSALDITMREDKEIGYVNFPSVNGKGLNTTFITGFQVYDNGDADKVNVAKAFVKYIYESDYIDYCAGALPASIKVSEKYAAELEPIQKYIGVADCGVNFTGNQPNWRGVRAVFYVHMQDLIYGEKSVEDVAKDLSDACNAAIDEGYAESTLHE
ncbi:MAG: extracellular solute-binding protein [Erysipelotrichaceae bacterium]|nr:extracellular solute-binding protein [Erysipelotrichaceae bacterium]